MLEARPAVDGPAAQDRSALQPQPCWPAAQPQPTPQVHDGPRDGVADDAAAALQPHWQAAPAQSAQVHEAVVGTFMAIS
jgi:hypothetical protein